MPSPRLPVAALIAAACLLAGCAGHGEDPPPDPTSETVATDPVAVDRGAGDADRGWARAYEWPDGLVAAAERHLQDSDLWLYDGVSPEVYRGESGRWRVFWYRRNPFDAQVWWDFVELTADGEPIATGSGEPFGGAATRPTTQPDG